MLSTFLVEIMAAIFDFYGSERLHQGGNQDSKEGEGRSWAIEIMSFPNFFHHPLLHQIKLGQPDK